MKLLLDTHAFLWWDSEPGRLPRRVLEACQDPANELLLSVASIWEIQIKSQLGRLELETPLSELVEHQRETNRIETLPILLPHVLKLEDLPLRHRDPFDRLLIAQALVEGAALVSRNEKVSGYSVETLWG